MCFGMTCACFALAFYQPFGLSRDYPPYESFLEQLRDDGFAITLATSRFEPGFVLASHLATALFASSLFVYSLLASAGVALKTAIACFFSRRTYVSLWVLPLYLVRYLPLHELTQLRASLAVAFLLTAFLLRWKDRRLLSLIVGLLSVAFHWSSVFVIPFLLFSVSTRRLLVIVAACEFLIVFLTLARIAGEASGSIQILNVYEAGVFTPPNPFSAALLLDIAMLGAGLLLWNKQSSPMKHVLALQAVGLAFFYASMDVPVFAHRVRELFSVFWVIYVAQGLNAHRHLRIVCALFIVASIALYSYIYFFNSADVYFQ